MRSTTSLLLVMLATACAETPLDPIVGGDASNTDLDAGFVDTSDAGFVDIDAGPPRAPRLVIASADGVGIWSAGAIAAGADPEPDVRLAVPGRPVGLAAMNDRLFVATSDATDAVLVFDDAWSLDASAPSSSAFSTSSFGGALSEVIYTPLHLDRRGALFVGQSDEGWRYFPSALSMGGDAALAATFTHEWMQLPAMAADELGDHALLGQISGAGVQIVRSYSTRSGAIAPDATLEQDCASWAMTIVDRRYYAACQTATDRTVHIWNDVTTLDEPRAPDVTLSIDPTPGGIFDLRVVRDTLYVATEDPSAVLVFRGASSITSDRAPDVTIADIGRSPRRIALDANDTLYVLNEAMGAPSLTIVDDAPASPSVRATLTMLDAPLDMLVLE